MVHTKQTVRELLDHLSDDCSIDEVLYHLYVIQEVEKGRADVAAGNLIPHEEVEEALRSKWHVGRAE